MRWPSATSALVAIVAIGAALRLADLAGQSLWLDEAFSVALARAPWSSFVYELRTREANMGLYFLALRPWLRLGSDEARIRLLSALFGIATIPVVAALATRLFDRRAGVYAALLMALDPLAIWASQEARAYSLVALLVSGSMWALVRAIDADAAAAPASRGAFGRWSVYVVTSALAVYAHFYAGLVLVAQAATLLVRPPGVRWSTVVAAAGALALLLAPLGLFLASAPHENIDWLRDAIATGAPVLLHQLPHSPVVAALAGYAIWWIAVIVAAGGMARRVATARARWALVLVVCWVVVPVGVPLLVSVLMKPVIEPRYLAVCVPGVAVAAGAVVSQLAPTPRRVLVSAVLALELFGDWAYFARFHKEDWRAATLTVMSNLRPGDAVLIYAPYGRRPFDYYVARDTGKATLSILYPLRSYADFTSSPTPPLALPTAVDSARAAGRAWLVLSHVGPDTTCARDLDAALRSTFPHVEDRSFPFVDVRLYASNPASSPVRGAPLALPALRCPPD